MGASMVGEEERFHGLPPLKRFKMLEKERVQQKRQSETSEVVKEITLQTSGMSEEVKILCCLPAKKRVCALQFFAHDEEEEQENKTIQLLEKKLSPVMLARPLQPINFNRELPISFPPSENKSAKRATAMKTKKMMNTSPVAQGDADVKLVRERWENQKLPVIVEEASTLEKLAARKKEGSCVASIVSQQTADYMTMVDPYIIPTVEKHKMESRPALRKAEADPAATNLASSDAPVVADEAHALTNPQMSLTDCGNRALTKKPSFANTGRALRQQKKIETTSVTQCCPIQDQQVSEAAEHIEKGVTPIKGDANCVDFEQTKEPDGEDDGVFCDICKESDAEPSDPIVFCDGCNVMVHASCYGSPLIDGIPDGDWFCRQCESESRRKKRDEGSKGGHVGFHAGGRTCASRVCCLCPSRKGAMKQTTGGAWAHLSCALYVPEVFYKRARGREGIECASVPAWRWELPCVVCSMRGQGSCIQCTEVGCCSTFHVSCALDTGLTIDYRNANALTKTPAIVIAFCPSHSRQALTRSERRRFKIVPRS